MAHLCATVHKVYNANLKQKQQQQQQQQHDHNNNNNVTPSSQSRMKVISSSGGNAGLAVTTVARNIPEMDVSVVVPETTKSMVVEKLRSLGAEVTVFGKNWDEADGLARRWVEEAKGDDGEDVSGSGSGSAVYVSPFDNPLLWTGHSTVIDEIVTQMLELPSVPKKMGAVLASVGGGGLLCGIFEGIERNYFGGDAARSDVVRGTKVVACETEGAASFAASFNHNNGKGKPSTVRLEGITSVATSLGALEVTPAVIQRANRHKDRGEMGGDTDGEDVVSYVCTDAEAVDACVNFAKDHRMLVEPACGASLAPLYSERLRTKLLGELLLEEGGNEEEESSAIVVEVCGGSGVDLELLAGWKAQFLGDA